MSAPLPPPMPSPVLAPEETPFYQHLVEMGRSEATATAYESDIRKFHRWNGGEVAPGHYGSKAREFINSQRRRDNVSRSSVIRYMSSIRAYAKFIGVDDPFVGYKAPRPHRPMAHPLPGMKTDVDGMVAAAKWPKHKLLIGLCGYAGLRVGEALTITPRSFVKDEQGYWWLTVIGKGDKYREVPVSDELRALLETHPPSHPDDPYVPMSDRGARQAITRMGEKAGVERAVSSHDLRHTFGSDIYNKTKDLRVVQELLGHASSSTTEGYTGVSQEAMRKAVMEKLT